MTPTRRVTLHNTTGTSNKVYELELQEGDGGGWIVVARWGRIGSTLREGTKTDGEVALAVAEDILEDLRTKRLAKGYYEHATWALADDDSDAEEVVEAQEEVEGGAPGDPGDDEPEEFPPPAMHPRCMAVLARLMQGQSAPEGAWPLARAIWRAGELELVEAEPLIRPWVDAREDELRYSAIWALARLGQRASLASLERRKEAGGRPEILRLIEEARRAILSQPSESVAFFREARGRLPGTINQLPWTRDAVGGAVDKLMTEGKKAWHRMAYADLYLIDDDVARPLVLEFARTAPLAAPEFRAIRWLFKAAELRRDAQLYGILARRFTLTESVYRISDYWSHSWGKAFGGRRKFTNAPGWADSNKRYLRGAGIYWQQVTRGQISQEGTKWAYSEATRQYLRRRVWRTLRRMGELGDPNFVKMATGVMLPYMDEDAEEAREVTTSRWHRVGGEWAQEDTTRGYGAWASRVVLSHLLYEGSTRHLKESRWRTFRLPDGAPMEEPEFRIEDPRVEAFPRVWDASPVALLHLLDESRCHEVHRFAARALHANEGLKARLDTRALGMLLKTPYPEGAQVALGIARARYDANSPDVALWSWMAASASVEAAAQAGEWLVGAGDVLREDADALVRVLLSRHEAAREAARQVCAEGAPVTAVAREVIGRVVVALMGMGGEDAEWAEGVAAALAGGLGAQLAALGDSIVWDLLSSELSACQVLAGEALLARQPGRVPDAFVSMLFDSEHERARAVAGRIFERMSDEELLAREALLSSLAVSSREDLREFARPIVGRLAADDRGFAGRFLELLAQVLEVEEHAEGVHAGIAKLVAEELAERLEQLGTERALELLAAKSVAAKEVGGRVLARSARAEDLEVRTLVWVARSESRVAREAGRGLIESAPGHVQAQPEVALGVLDTEWADTREWAIEWLEGGLGEAWTPSLWVSVCDMKWEDVGAFGRAMIRDKIDGGSGPEYLLKLTEHPRAEMQGFAAEYLERYAGGSPERIEEMGWFFGSVLARVRKGAVAKRRALDFLEVEAARSREGARVAAKVLGVASATIAVRERARAIEILTRIAQEHPDLESPLELVEWEDRRGV